MYNQGEIKWPLLEYKILIKVQILSQYPLSLNSNYTIDASVKLIGLYNNLTIATQHGI